MNKVQQRRMRFAVWKQTVRDYALALLVIVVVCLFVYSRTGTPFLSAADLAEAKWQTAETNVTRVFPRRIEVALGNQTAMAEGFYPMWVGERVRVVYVVGKYGQVFVESVEPLNRP